jgi:hypothetical protein
MSNARDELTTLILGKTAPRAADAVLAAGYSKPRTITTAEELDALGFEAVVIDPCGTPAVCVASGPHGNQWTFGLSGVLDSETLLLSGTRCTVLHEGEAE